MKTTNSLIKTGVFISAAVFFFSAKPAYAQTYATSASFRQPEAPEIKEEDRRVEILKAYLRKHNSPLSQYAEDFIVEADKNRLDWKLLPAIAGVESTFGQFLPNDSYNGWGFGIYGDHVTRFSSWKEAIAKISKSLRHDYMDKYNTTTVEQIGYVYAADRTWPYKVKYFINELEDFKSQSAYAYALSISL